MTSYLQYKKAFVLLSGGVDSTTTLAKAIEDLGSAKKVIAVSINYGQRHNIEIERAARMALHYDVEHRILDVASALGNSMLTDSDQQIPDISYAEIQGISPTYVPFRNGFMLARLAAEAQNYVNEVFHDINSSSPVAEAALEDLKDLVWLYFGAHAEDSANWAYPDCTPEFVGAMANAIYIGTYQAVRLLTPFNYNTKAEIIAAGVRLGVPYHLTWSCYAGGEKHCGVCPTCRARKEAFKLAPAYDPTEYNV